MKTIKLKIEGMSCGHCVAAVQNVLLELPGVHEADVKLESKSATVTFDEAKVTVEQMKEAIVEEGYEA